MFPRGGKNRIPLESVSLVNCCLSQIQDAHPTPSQNIPSYSLISPAILTLLVSFLLLLLQWQVSERNKLKGNGFV